jgi:hypothetical protein
MESAEKESGQALVGMFCHTFLADGTYQYQGYIHAYLGNGYYLVQLYSAMDGNPTYSQIATINDMRAGGWRFYNNQADWLSSANKMLDQMARSDYTPPGSPPTLGLS